MASGTAMRGKRPASGPCRERLSARSATPTSLSMLPLGRGGRRVPTTSFRWHVGASRSRHRTSVQHTTVVTPRAASAATSELRARRSRGPIGGESAAAPSTAACSASVAACWSRGGANCLCNRPRVVEPCSPRLGGKVTGTGEIQLARTKRAALLHQSERPSTEKSPQLLNGSPRNPWTKTTRRVGSETNLICVPSRPATWRGLVAY